MSEKVLPKLFHNDESSARPAGSMQVLKVVWWKSSCPNGDMSSLKVKETLTVEDDGSVSVDESLLGATTVEIIDGF